MMHSIVYERDFESGMNPDFLNVVCKNCEVPAQLHNYLYAFIVKDSNLLSYHAWSCFNAALLFVMENLFFKNAAKISVLKTV